MSELTEQLRCPNGEKGIEVSIMMNKTNRTMIEHSINCLDLKDNDHVLEIGHGNAGHIDRLLSKKDTLRYSGVDISPLMIAEAERINREFIEMGVVEFRHYEGDNIPYDNNYFDVAFSVNTIYFWKYPNVFLCEIFRVLKDNGRFVLTFADADFMRTLPYVEEPTFKLYTSEEIEDLSSSCFNFESIIEQTEMLRNKLNHLVERKFYSMIFVKKQIV